VNDLQLTLCDKPVRSFDLTPLTPTALAGKSVDELKRLRLRYGRQRVALGDFFSVTENKSSGLHLKGINEHCHRIGQGLKAGTIRVTGTVGDELGREMRGGIVAVKGNAGDGVGAGMIGGHIAVSGVAGDCVGGLVPGATRGMNDGLIQIGKSTGARTGERMRRGLIIVAEDTGVQTGARMIAGTVIVLGTCGPQVGISMRRGSILLAEAPLTMTPTFNDCGEFELSIIPIIRHYVGGFSKKLARNLSIFRYTRRWCGDIAYGGKGELLIAAQRL